MNGIEQLRERVETTEMLIELIEVQLAIDPESEFWHSRLDKMNRRHSVLQAELSVEIKSTLESANNAKSSPWKIQPETCLCCNGTGKVNGDALCLRCAAGLGS